MTTLFIESFTSDFTVYLEYPIENPKTISLLNSTLYDDLYNHFSKRDYYFVYSDLVDPSHSLSFGKPSEILATVKSDSINGEDSPIQVKARTLQSVHSIRFWITDGDHKHIILTEKWLPPFEIRCRNYLKTYIE